MTSEAAIQANYTRKVRAAADEMRHTYGDAKYDLLEDLIVPYLIAAVGEGGRVADLLGGGRSAKALTDAGLRVVSVDDLRLYTKKGEGGKGWPREFAVDVARHIAAEAGSERLILGDAVSAMEDVDAFYFDGMGPLGPDKPAGRFLADLKPHLRVRHVVVTYLASRIDGMGDLSGGKRSVYDIAARVTLKDLGFNGVYQFSYQSGSVPMGVVVACNHAYGSCAAWRVAEYRKTRPAKLAYARKYREADPEKKRRQGREWYAQNRERAIAYGKAYYEAHRPAILERERQRRLSNKGDGSLVAAAIERRTKPHPCSNGCGAQVRRAGTKTCSPECRADVRRRTGRMSMIKINAAKAVQA